MSEESRKARTTVVTGARSGIGRATAELLQARNERVIGIDLAGSEIEADLASPAGRARAIEALSGLCPEGIDALIACAGLSTSDGPAVVSVNYFGTVELAAGVRPWLARGHAPRAVLVSYRARSLSPQSRRMWRCYWPSWPAATTATWSARYPIATVALT